MAFELEGRDASTTLQAYCERDGRELLVMDAFGHSRAREFVLGGVTRSVLDAPKLTIFISHCPSEPLREDLARCPFAGLEGHGRFLPHRAHFRHPTYRRRGRGRLGPLVFRNGSGETRGE